MSTENRNKVLLGFGALVVVVIVAIALWPANFRKEDASGAIGAVQKHRAPQITQKDVILGDENVRHQQKVLYADFFADAASLRAMAASRKFDAATQLSSELRTRYAAEAEAVLAEAEIAARTSAARANLRSEIAEAQSILMTRKQLTADDMRELNGKLAHIIVVCEKEMNARSARIFNDAGQELAAAAKRLETAKLDNEFLAVAKQYEDVEALMSRPLAAVSLADEGAYLSAIQMETKVLADTELAVKQIGDQEVATKFIATADELAARASSNIRANTELMSEMAARFGHMDDEIALAGRILGSRAGIEAGSAAMLGRNLAAAREALRSRENEFYARANVATGEELAAVKKLNSEPELQGRLMNLQTRLQARQQP